MNAQQRLLLIFLQLMNGKKISKQELMEEFDKKASTIQRDIVVIEEVLQTCIHNSFIPESVRIDRDGKGNYQLKHFEDISNISRLTDADIFILLKILYSTRIFNKKEISKLSNKLLTIADEKKFIQQFLANEQLYYQGISVDDLMGSLEMIIYAIVNHQMLEFSYSKNGITEIFQRVPNAIYYSDLYFFMLSSSQTAKDDAELTTANKFRINSMKEIKVISSSNKVAYSEKFEGGLLRTQTVLPFLGKPITIILDFYYDSIYVLDRFPHSKITQINEDGSFRIEIKGNDGYGMKMWLSSQSHMVKVISPRHLREYLIQDMKDTLKLYGVDVD
ncbi:helix-turn-helix transcriptional regulator [Vagococcus hydrophili]|uniref:WYL domain-containing protein n=1 Tax=Vagococcus hydrophili TaxID=2714947 RepID=A0A6G8ATD9_9ENTE|nr:WYL domain-containing protein [Vagococcus hydrophili]QIL48351.1 WYL domain-containing protein [Vagococcus hydrophili]